MGASYVQNMLSVLSSFLLSSQRIGSDTANYSIVTESLIMLLEILNTSKEVYVCLYVLLPLAALTQAYPNAVKSVAEQVSVLLKKILSPLPGSLEESCLLYVGHWILALTKHNLLSNDTHQQVLLLLQARLAKAQMPSTAKVTYLFI